MKWLVAGATGQLGSEIVSLVARERPDVSVVAVDRAQMDVAQPEAIREIVGRENPDVLINCAAWTDVDAAESNARAVQAVNSRAPGVMAEVLARRGNGLLVHISSDFVFGGRESTAVPEYYPVSPLSAYGHSKALGEIRAREALSGRLLIIRTAWLYGSNHSNFVSSILGKLRAGEPFEVVNDQWGHPSWSRDIAERIHLLVRGFHSGTVASGTYHAVNSGVASRWEFARAIADISGYETCSIMAVDTVKSAITAARPKRVELVDTKGPKLGLPPMRPWRDALQEALARMGAPEGGRAL